MPADIPCKQLPFPLHWWSAKKDREKQDRYSYTVWSASLLPVQESLLITCRFFDGGKSLHSHRYHAFSDRQDPQKESHEVKTLKRKDHEYAVVPCCPDTAVSEVPSSDAPCLPYPAHVSCPRAFLYKHTGSDEAHKAQDGGRPHGYTLHATYAYKWKLYSSYSSCHADTIRNF